MAGFMESTQIQCEPQAIFDFLTAPANLASVLDHVLKAAPVTGEKMMLGSWIRLKLRIQGQEIDATAEVSLFDPPRHYAFTTERWGIAITFHYLIYRLQQGSRLSFICDVEGEGMKRLLTPPIAAMIRQEEGNHLQRIKTALEMKQ